MLQVHETCGIFYVVMTNMYICSVIHIDISINPVNQCLGIQIFEQGRAVLKNPFYLMIIWGYTWFYYPIYWRLTSSRPMSWAILLTSVQGQPAAGLWLPFSDVKWTQEDMASSGFQSWSFQCPRSRDITGYYAEPQSLYRNVSFRA